MGAELTEGEDFYLEDGLMVFTAAYHAKRGYCCGNGCRHCPYDPPSPTRRPSAASEVEIPAPGSRLATGM